MSMCYLLMREIVKALEDEHNDIWFVSMNEDIYSFDENHTFKLVELPKG